MKTSICTYYHFLKLIKFRPIKSNTLFLCINHKYQKLSPRYIIYKVQCNNLNRIFETNSKDELKLHMDLRGMNIKEKIIIRPENFLIHDGIEKV